VDIETMRRVEATGTSRGDESDDFEAFVAATGSRLLRTAVLLCGDHHLAEDLTQTTYAKLFASWRRVTASTNPAAYARTTLLRTFLSQQRKRSSSERPSDSLPEVTASESDHPRRLDLLVALRELSATDRAVLVLRFWEDLSVAETAELLDIKAATCRARTSRALARLRTRFPELEEQS
jgi:RNA polymerase sigma-70 factor (sigma-E family)